MRLKKPKAKAKLKEYVVTGTIQIKRVVKVKSDRRDRAERIGRKQIAEDYPERKKGYYLFDDEENTDGIEDVEVQTIHEFRMEHDYVYRQENECSNCENELSECTCQEDSMDRYEDLEIYS